MGFIQLFFGGKVNMFRNLSYKFQRLMAGRYGYDELSKSLIFISLALVAVYYLTHIRLFYYLAVFDDIARKVQYVYDIFEHFIIIEVTK